MKLTSDTLEIHKGTSLKQMYKVEGTPFELVEIEGKGWMIAFGKHRLTEWRETEMLALQELEANKWDITISIMEVVINEMFLKKPTLSTEGE